MNVKMLEMQYGNLENSPHIITGKLLEKEGGSLTEDLRRRLRYLCHLPLTCQFEVAEIELKPPIVSEEVLFSFRGNFIIRSVLYFHFKINYSIMDILIYIIDFIDQLALRHKRRQQREREERKREKKITEEENKRMGRYPTPIVHIDSQRHFPQWQPELLFSEYVVFIISLLTLSLRAISLPLNEPPHQKCARCWRKIISGCVYVLLQTYWKEN